MTSHPILPPFSQELALSRFQQAASDAKDQFRVEAAAIRDNPRLTAVGKTAALNELRERTRAAIKGAESSHHAAIEKRTADLKRTLFGRGKEVADAALTISYRDAAQRAAEVTAVGKDVPKKSLELMEWALQNGDIPLQKAVLKVAFDWRLEDVVDAFVAGHSDQKDSANELWDLTEERGRGDIADLVFGVGNDLWPEPGSALPQASGSTIAQDIPYHRQHGTGTMFP